MIAPLVVVLEPLAPATLGVWCGRCALPSAACLDCGRTVRT